jgi:hypothetical protein
MAFPFDAETAAPTLPEALADRLRRAVHLDVARLEARAWRVTGGNAPHIVRAIDTAPGYTCDCEDQRIRRRNCKHVIAVRLYAGDSRVIRALRSIVALPRRPPVALGVRAPHNSLSRRSHQREG